MAANCVLSSILAMRTEANTAPSIFQSTTNFKKSLQTQNILHVIKTCRIRFQISCSTQRTQCKSCAAACLVGDFDAFADTGVEHGMVADNVAAAHRGKADGI